MDVFHILNRGVEKRDIVLDDDDRMRFVRSLYIFNNKNSAPNSVSQARRDKARPFGTYSCMVPNG
jgi:hypothetical protein